MEKEEIKLLLEKYYDATATVEEEQRLREALLSGDAGSEFETDRQLFEALEASAPAEKYPDTLDARLDTLVGRLDRRRRVVRHRRWAIFSAAASLLVVFGIAQFAFRGGHVEPEAVETMARNVRIIDNAKDARAVFYAVNADYEEAISMYGDIMAEADSITAASQAELERNYQIINELSNIGGL